jgi:hypothetical protein
MWRLRLRGAVMRFWLGETYEQKPSRPEHHAKEIGKSISLAHQATRVSSARIAGIQTRLERLLSAAAIAAQKSVFMRYPLSPGPREAKYLFQQEVSENCSARFIVEKASANSTRK